MSGASSIRITAAALALLLIGCAGAPASYPDEVTLSELRREMLRECDERANAPCPYILLDARPWSAYSDARLDRMDGSDVDRIATTKGACLVEWRFGVTGYTQAIEIWTKGHEGPAREHAEMPIEDRMVCEFEARERDEPEGYTVADRVVD